jgi:hypothetical protein
LREEVVEARSLSDYLLIVGFVVFIFLSLYCEVAEEGKILIYFVVCTFSQWEFLGFLLVAFFNAPSLLCMLRYAMQCDASSI